MAELDDKVIVTKSKITDIADALREEMSESYEYSLPTMVEKVHELGQGQGSEYTAGVGIDITNRVVSVVDTLMIRGSANGSVASIDDGADDVPMKSCTVDIEPVQSGSGDPSPSNVRPITGWTECNITVADDETTPTISNVYNIEFPSQAGTVYGGTLDVTNGVLTVKYISVDMSSIEWKLNTKSGSRIRTDGNIAKSIGSATIISNTLSSQYKTITSSDWYNKNERGVTITYSSQGSDGAMGLNDNGITNLTSAADIQTYLSGIQLVYELATPTTYNLTPTEVKTLLGINNIFADCGDVDVEYVRDATLIINKLLELASGNNNRTMMKSAVVEKTDEVQEQKKDSVEEDLDA